MKNEVIIEVVKDEGPTFNTIQHDTAQSEADQRDIAYDTGRADLAYTEAMR